MRSSGGRMYAGGASSSSAHGLVRSGSLGRAQYLGGGGGGGGIGFGGSQRSLVELGVDPMDPMHHQQLRAVTLKRASAQHALGFSVRGGRDVGFGIYVSKVEAGGGAERAGMVAGDRIVAVNGRSFENISQAEAIRILKSFVTLRLTLCATGRVPASTCVLHQTYTWVDRMGRRVSPPDDYEPQFHRSSSAWSLYGVGQSGKLRKVTLSLMEGESLGLMIRGGTEYGLGIFITGVDEHSAADRANLQIGDQILEANDASFVDITHDEAVRILKHSKHLVMKILDVGKIPFSCTMYDEMYWGVPGMDDDSLSGMSADDEMQSPCLVSTADLETLRILDEKAKLILTKREQSTLHYYRTEYDKGQVTLDALVAVLLELFNTPDKFSLLSEIRELIQARDREKFDDLIYSRELEVKKACQKLGSSLENMVADRKADKIRRSSAADCYRYAAIDKFTGKIAQHNSCEQNNKDQCHFSCSSEAESRRRISSMFEGASRRGLSASTQALYWSGDPYGDMDARTPSEDSGVDLANGFHYGSRLGSERAATVPSMLRSGHYPGGGLAAGARRTASGLVGPTSPQQRRGRISGWPASDPTDTHHEPHGRLVQQHQQQRRLPGGPVAISASAGGAGSATAGRRSIEASLDQPSLQQQQQQQRCGRIPVPQRSHSATGAPVGYRGGHADGSAPRGAAGAAALAALYSPQANRRHVQRLHSGVQESEATRTSGGTAKNCRAEDQIHPGDRHRGWGRHPPPPAAYNQHPPSRGGSAGDWPDSRSRDPGRGWAEREGTVAPHRGQPRQRGVRRALPPRDGVDRRTDAQTDPGDAPTLHNVSPRRQTMIQASDVRSASAGLQASPRHHVMQQQQQPISQSQGPRSRFA